MTKTEVTAEWPRHLVNVAVGYKPDDTDLLERLLRFAGLSVAAFTKQHVPVTLEQHDALFERVAFELHGSDVMAVAMAAKIRADSLGPAGLLMGLSRDVQGASEVLDTYRHHIGPDYISPIVRPHGSAISITYPVPAKLAQNKERGRVSLLQAFKLVEGVVKHDCRVVTARFQHKPPTTPRERNWYAEQFPGADIYWEQSESQLVVDVPYHHPISTHDPHAYRLVEALLQYAPVPHTASVEARVRSHVRGLLETAAKAEGPRRCVARRALAQSAVADALNTSSRTLDRELQKAGTTLGDILDELLHLQAERLLARGDAVQEVAHLVGYGNATTFCRAFRRWTGMTPKDYCATDSKGCLLPTPPKR